jgi:hypothetical protein
LGLAIGIVFWNFIGSLLLVALAKITKATENTAYHTELLLECVGQIVARTETKKASIDDTAKAVAKAIQSNWKPPISYSE